MSEASGPMRSLIRNNPLGRRILIAILVFSSAFTAAATAVQLYESYQSDLHRIDLRLDDLHRTLVPRLEDSVWALDSRGIRLALGDTATLPYVAKASVHDDQGETYAAGALPADGKVSVRQFDLSHPAGDGRPVSLGHLTIAVDLHPVYEKLWGQFEVILATQAVKTFSVSMFILLVISVLVQRPLRALAGYADRLNLESLGKAPHIPRAFRSRQPDDLDQIADALDRMRQRLLEDIAQLDRARETSEKLSRAVEASPAPVLIADASGRVEYVNQALTTVTGFDTEDCIGMSGLGQGVGLLPDSVPGLPAGEKIVTAVRREGEWRGELLCRRKDASTYWQYLSVSTIRNEQGDITHFLAVMEDITALKQYEDRLLQQSSFDQLTRLPNRLLAYDRLSQALQLSEQDGGGVAVASIALDDFSNLNASLGLAAGDAVLVQVAERLRRTVPEGATVARMGGDEFLVLLPDVHSSVSAEILLKRTLLEFAKPFEVDSEQITLHASAGIAMHPGDGHTPDELLRNAASAMHEAKRQPGLSTHFYQAGMNAGGRSRMLMASRLQDVARNGELQLHYQPIVVPATGETAFMEALVRWQSPEFGAVSPVDFIDLAERSGAIVEIGEWILKKACEDAVTWRAAGKSWGVSVNLSPVQFREPGFHDVVKRALQESDLPAAALKLELTEQMLLHDSEAVLERFQRIREMGVQFSIDDFGTGYSSLSYLKTFPFDWLKIDRAFIRDLPNSESDRVLAQVIISMAHTFGMQVVAEGVEDHEHVELLGEYGCDFLQGYFFSRPRPLVDFLSADEDRAG